MIGLFAWSRSRDVKDDAKKRADLPGLDDDGDSAGKYVSG